MHILVRPFHELQLQELYDFLHLRSEVFVVEQDCVYQDIDGKDAKAIHVLGYIENKLIAYARIFAPGIYFSEAAIGRVVVNQEFRGNRFGHQILESAIGKIEEVYGKGDVRLSAQQYLIRFYQDHGFRTTGKGYLEDGIPHIAMIRSEN